MTAKIPSCVRMVVQEPELLSQRRRPPGLLYARKIPSPRPNTREASVGRGGERQFSLDQGGQVIDPLRPKGLRFTRPLADVTSEQVPMKSRRPSHRRRSTRGCAGACLGRSQGPGDASGQAKNRDGHFTAEGALTHPWESPLLDGTSFATTGPKRLPSFCLTLCRQRAGAVWRKTRTSSISKLPETAVLWCQDTKAFRLQDTKALCGFVFQ